MSTTSTIVYADRKSAGFSRVLAKAGDFVELSKPRIAVLELVAVAVAAFAAATDALSPWLLVHALLATGLVAASASAWNQWLEQARDARMARTAARPLPAARLTQAEALIFGILTLVAGVAYLAFTVGPLAAGFGAATWILYVAVYTPLKTRTSWNTAVGAVAGALPAFIGGCVAGNPGAISVWALAGVIFLWQFPHFLAIAWLYREDYARAGYRMMTTTDSGVRRCRWYALGGAVLLLPVSLLPLWEHGASPLAWCVVAILGSSMLHYSIRFFREIQPRTARQLLRVSLIYLPAWFLVVALVSWR